MTTSTSSKNIIKEKNNNKETSSKRKVVIICFLTSIQVEHCSADKVNHIIIKALRLKIRICAGFGSLNTDVNSFFV